MKKILLISLLLFSKVAFSQTSDSFTDGDFTQNPVWSGDLNYFYINAQKQLQSKGEKLASQTISLSTVNRQSLNASWEFLVQLNFDPTTTNFVRVYLSADQENLKGSLNGYFVQIGETGATDGFHLYRQTGTSTTKIITGPSKIRTNTNLVIAKIKVTRDNAGKWNLYSDVAVGNSFTLEGSVLDNTFTTSKYAGVFCKYATASRYDQYIFDDFEIKELIPDTIPPFLKSVAAIDGNQLEVTFSEPLDSVSATDVSHYALSNGYGNPLNVVPTPQANVYKLIFAKQFGTGEYSLLVKDVKDKKGNNILPDSHLIFKYIKPYVAQYGDLVINEIFANPTGSAGLPQKEFVEIWNRTDEYILTKGWKYADQTFTFTFSVDTIKPNQYFILCAKADTALFKSFGKTIGLSPWPSLNNDKDILALTDNLGTLIDRVGYSDSWYNDDVKKKGGFSIELIDPKNRCKGIQNWSASVHLSGGTPGGQNSIYQSQISTEAPKLINTSIMDSVTLKVEFSKPVDSLSAVQLVNYTINNGVGKPSSATLQSTSFKNVILKFSTPFERGIENTLTINNLSDCAGNLISPEANTAKLFIAKKIAKNDILVSEILFNPKAGSVDFVEIYNNTDNVLDMKDLQVANVDSLGKPANIKVLAANNLFIQPKRYWVISTNTSSIQQNYFCQNQNQFIQLTSMPKYNNDQGTVLLLSNNALIDRFDYNEKMHLSLLQNADGVSLERVSFSKSTNEAGNFKSAAASVGFATPSYKNSQEPNGEENYARLRSKVFSPDGDNFEDVMTLEYAMAESAAFATVNVYSDQGKLIRRLLKNETIGTKGTLIWDGLNDNGDKAAVGIYVILFDVFYLNGTTQRFNNTCVLAAKLN